MTKRTDDYYADFDENTGLHCVFGTESGFCYATYADKMEAETKAAVMHAEFLVTQEMRRLASKLW